MNTEQLTAYICGKIDGAEIDFEPFPHLVIGNFWPDDFYEALLEELPGQDFRRRGDYGMGGKTVMASRVNPSHHWGICYEVLESDAVTQTLCKKWRAESGISRCLLHKDTNGYGIPPHTDAVSKRVAYVLYMAPEWEDIAIKGIPLRGNGTYLLKPLFEKDIDRWGDLHQPWYNFKIEKVVTYRPNILVSWPRSEHSFHAVDVRFHPGSPYQERVAVRGFVFDPDADLPFIIQEDLKERGVGA